MEDKENDNEFIGIDVGRLIVSSLERYTELIETIRQNTEKMMISLQPFLKALSEKVVNINFKGLTDALLKFSEALNNPNSFFSYESYKNDLENYYWVWPYKMDAVQLKEILTNNKDETSFDKIMIKYFTKEKTNQMITDISNNLPKKHKVIFKQAINSFNNKDFAIANMVFYSIIEDLLAGYTQNKGNNTRNTILNPVVDYYCRYQINEVPFIFELCLLSNCINYIYKQYDFNSNEQPSNHKKVSRHLSQHGKKYSNQKIDCLLLLNCIYKIIYFEDILKPFKGLLVRNKDKSKRDEKFMINKDKMNLLDKRVHKFLDITKKDEKQ